MAPTSTTWSHEFDTVRREKLFRNPPKDHSAYPALHAAISPHIDSFNALFEPNGLISHALKDIGTKTYLDGEDGDNPKTRNRLDIRIKEVNLGKSVRPTSDKFARGGREVFPAECRERHCTYRGKLTAILEYRINGGDAHEFVRDIGQVPLMVMVCISYYILKTGLTNSRPIGVISKRTLQLC